MLIDPRRRTFASLRLLARSAQRTQPFVEVRAGRAAGRGAACNRAAHVEDLRDVAAEAVAIFRDLGRGERVGRGAALEIIAHDAADDLVRVAKRYALGDQVLREIG